MVFRTLPLKIGGNRKSVKEWLDFDPKEFDLTSRVPKYNAKFHQNLVRSATVEEVTDRQTDTQTRVIL